MPNAAEIAAKLSRHKRQHDGTWLACCPCHDDKTPSLHISDRPDGSLGLYCYAGCSFESVESQLGLRKPQAGLTLEDIKRKSEEVYIYSETQLVARRFIPKAKCMPFHKIDGIWKPGKGTDKWPPYSLRFLQDNPEAPIFIVEGEKAVNRLNRLWDGARVALTWQGGANNAKNFEFSKYINGQIITLVADDDQAGRNAMRQIAEKIGYKAQLVLPNIDNSGNGLDDELDPEDDHEYQLDQYLKSWKIQNPQQLEFEKPAKTQEKKEEKNKKDSETEIEIVTASQLTMRKAEFVIQNTLPTENISLLAGPAGQGKTTLSLEMAAAISANYDFAGFPTQEGSVLMWSGEDIIETTLLPRLVASGADLDKVHFVAATKTKDEKRDFSPADDMDKLISKIKDIKDIKLLILDPVIRIADNVRNANQALEIRKSMTSIVDCAKENKIAVLGITHFSKQQSSFGSGVLDRVLGSQAWTAVARMVLVASRSETLDSHVLAVAKSNISADNIARKYRMTHDIQVTEEITASRTETDTTAVQMAINEIFAVSVKTKETIEKTNSQSTANDIIIHILKDGSAKTWPAIVKEGKKEGVSERTLRRARDQLKAAGNMQVINIGRNRMWSYTPDIDFINNNETANEIDNYANSFKR